MSEPVRVSGLAEVVDIMERRAANATAATPSLAGKPYCPSSGSEGVAFEEAMCANCDHYRATRDGDMDCRKRSATPYGEHRRPMHILEQAWVTADVLDGDFPTEWRYDEQGRPTCTAWKERTEAADDAPPVKRLCGGARTSDAEWAAYRAAMGWS